MSEMQKTYDPSLVEEKWYRLWQEKGFFKSDPTSKKPPYCIILPPPNVTGVLHMGHALVDTIQDILIRWKRMSGFEALWIPGTDHAGISTQTVVERHLHAKTGKRKSDFSREEFLTHIWAWKNEHQERILNQLKKLGCSLDWNYLRFTMDDQSTLAVQTMFKKLYDDGLIYQGDYLVNWDPVIGTAIADDEVEFEEKNSCLWYIQYPISNSDETLTIATTRPETLIGDVAVAVSPRDERYSHLIGKTVKLPLTNRIIPIIADHYVDPEFGTGAVKITPAHDFNDYEIGERHNLPLINIMNPNGTLNEVGGEFENLSMEEARGKIISRLRDFGLLKKIEPHLHRVGISYRSKAIIEPYLSKQWFIKMEPFKEKLLNAVKEERVKIVPNHWDKVYFHWIKNLKDWCISRQLWWGHRIPIWYNIEDPSEKICHIGDDIPDKVKENPELWRQEEDVLDTWFSSALWPLTTLGWPKKTPELKKFYPTSTLVTGHDILFFWVARMIFMGEYASNDIPFHQTFIHGLIYGKSYWRENKDSSISYVLPKERVAYEMGETVPKDVFSKWEKMSKSKGNVIDPIEIIDQYGADAMRLALCSSVTHARQIDLDRRRFEEYKNFANKMWNAARFIFINLGSVETFSSKDLSDGIDHTLFTLDDHWILSRLNQIIQSVNQKFTDYEFNDASKLIYEFFWDEFCAYYVEICKPYLFDKEGTLELKLNKQKLLVFVLLSSIRLMHPIAPFITEEIFFLLQNRFPNLPSNFSKLDPYMSDVITALSTKSCMLAPYPTVLNPKDHSIEIEKHFTLLQELIYSLRNIRAEMQIPPSVAIDVGITCKDEKLFSLIEKNTIILSSLIKIRKIHLTKEQPQQGLSVSTAIVQGIQIQVPLPTELKEKEQNRLTKEITKQKAQVDALGKKLENKNFIEKAPNALVEKTQETLKSVKALIIELESKLNSLL